MLTISSITTAIPRMTIDGVDTCYTQGMVIDHVARTISGAVIQMTENEPITDILRSLRSGELFNVRFVTKTPDKEIVEYDGDALPIMVRVRPTRSEMLMVKFRLRLLG